MGRDVLDFRKRLKVAERGRKFAQTDSKSGGGELEGGGVADAGGGGVLPDEGDEPEAGGPPAGEGPPPGDAIKLFPIGGGVALPFNKSSSPSELKNVPTPY